MIKVYKDKDIAIVTRGLYEEIYKPLGYKIYKETEKVNNKKLESMKNIEDKNKEMK